MSHLWEWMFVVANVVSFVAWLFSERRFRRAVEARAQALMLCDRLQREGRGLHGATLEELIEIKKGLDA